MSVHPRMVVLAALLAALSASSVPVQACALEDDVSLSRDTLNHYYPDALDVLSRAVEARRAGVLAAATPVLPSAMHMQRLMGAVLRFDKQLRSTVHAQRTDDFALLLIESMLWSRFPVPKGGASSELHVAGPRDGDVVVVTSEDVLRQVVAGRMSLAEAKGKGWLRLYGPDVAAARLMRMLGPLGAASATPSQ